MRIVHPPRTAKAARVGADALARFPYCVLWIDPQHERAPSKIPRNPEPRVHDTLTE